MMEKFKNLPMGTKIELTEEAIKREYNKGFKTMTIIGKRTYHDEYYVEELKNNLIDSLKFDEIKRVISYPIDRDKLKLGVKVLIRSDLELDKNYDGEVWTTFKKEKIAGKVFTIHRSFNYRGDEFYQIGDDESEYICDITILMIEKIIEEPDVELVDGVEALVAMKAGKYANEGNLIYRLKEKELQFINKVTANNRTRWVKSISLMSVFLSDEYEILDELPDWEIEKPNPFKIDDIVIRKSYDFGVENCIRVTQVVDSKKFHGEFYRGSATFDPRFAEHFRPATPEEELAFYKARCKYLEGDR